MLSPIGWSIAIGVVVVVLPLFTALCFASTLIRFGRKNCLHCLIVKAIGRRLEYGEISRWGAMNNLVLVMADILATVPIEEAKKITSAIIASLSEAEVKARERHIHEPALARRRGWGRRKDCPAR
jgi:hypothetical protein